MELSQIQEIWESIKVPIFEYGLQIIGAVVTLIIGSWVIKKITNAFVKALNKKEVDPTLIPTLKGVVRVFLYVALIMAIISQVGIETSGFLAIFGAAGLAIGLSLQGSLSNFAGGILILTLKPFKAGDFVTINGESGTVHSVTIINTVLKTTDNKTIYLPNAAVAGANITNYTEEPTRRWDKVFGIGYADDFDKAKKIILEFLNADERVIKEPKPFVRVGNLGDSSVDITVRAWVKKEDYWALNFDMIEKVKKEFDKQGISIPFPQRDVHIFNEK